MGVIIAIFLGILFILRLKYLIQLFFSMRFWLGIVGQTVFFFAGAFMLGMHLQLPMYNEVRHGFIIFFIALTWIFFNFMFYNFRAPVVFLFGLVTLGLIAAAAAGGDGGGGDGADYTGDHNFDFPPDDLNALGFSELAMGSEFSSFDASSFSNFQTELPEMAAFESNTFDTYMNELPTFEPASNDLELFNAGAYEAFLNNTEMDVSLQFDANNNHVPDYMDHDLNNNLTPDILDRDMDNDGIIDFIDNDMDNDGMPDYYDNDMDNDRIPDNYDSKFNPKA